MERVLAALSGSFADRRAWTLTLSLYGARLCATPLERYYRESRYYVEGQLAVVDRFAPDIVFGPFALALEAEAYGSELAWFEKAPPNVRRPIPRAAADALRRRTPDSAQGLSFLVDSVRRLAESQGRERPVAGIIVAPIDLPALIFGIDEWLDILLFDRPLASSILDVSIEHFIALSRAYFAAGAAFVATPVMFANRRILTPALIESLALPVLARAFASAGGPIVFHHGAMPIEDLIGIFRGLPGLAGFVIDESDRFATIRETLGPEMVLLGGFSGPNMERRSVEKIRALAGAALEDRAGDPRFILASTAADVPWDTPPENIEAVASLAASIAGDGS